MIVIFTGRPRLEWRPALAERDQMLRRLPHHLRALRRRVPASHHQLLAAERQLRSLRVLLRQLILLLARPLDEADSNGALYGGVRADLAGAGCGASRWAASWR